MGANSKIEWTDASWNPLRAFSKLGDRRPGWHCEHVTEACRNCYAEAINRRLGTKLEFKPGHREHLNLLLDERILLQPLRWRRPRKIFPCSMTDLFGSWVTDEQLDRIFAVMALCPQHTFIVLTKRPERMREYVSGRHVELLLDQCPSDGSWPMTEHEMLARLSPFATPEHRSVYRVVAPTWPLPNVWLLVSICDQLDADKFIPILLDTPAAVRGVSYEPALGPVDFARIEYGRVYGTGLCNALTGERHGHVPNSPLGFGAKLDWIICGGESGSNARPMNPQWARDARDQCAAAGVPFFHKQNGEFASVSEVEGAGAHFTFPDGRTVRRVGKKRAGRLLNGKEHNAFPKVTA